MRGARRVRGQLRRRFGAVRLRRWFHLPLALRPRRERQCVGGFAPRRCPAAPSAMSRRRRRAVPAADEAVLRARRACVLPPLRTRAGLAPQRWLRRHGEVVVFSRPAMRGHAARPRRLGAELGCLGPLRRERRLRRHPEVLGSGVAAVHEDRGAAERRPQALDAQLGCPRWRSSCDPQRPQWAAAPPPLGAVSHHERGELLRPRRRHLCDPRR
mmetsp:Transcript_64089/g.185739  ORF Transcript_64089/g.185739 Transcript_64089/m.185739 type:complete len:213 (-) Transcript_64089:429-1067(-)